MAKLVISTGGMNVREYLLEQERVTIGRNSVNDIVLSEPVVSGEHAALQTGPSGTSITDLNSTNGTFVNGLRVKKSPLHHNDVIAIGSHELRYVDNTVQDFASTLVLTQTSDEDAAKKAGLQVLNGPRVGTFMPITKERTALGKPGVQVAVIMQKGSHYELLAVPVSGVAVTTRLNGKLVGKEALPLTFGDEIEIADVRLAFVQHSA
jgi:pSer/pThr/pTyr-binding forkhead associated (FHA) protein